MTKPSLVRSLLVLVALVVPVVARPAAAQDNSRTFPETGHTVRGRFLQYWEQHGGLAQQGFPLTEEMTEVSDLNGKTYTVQYFERAVFELHPENQPPNNVLLSLLGTFALQAKQTPQATPTPKTTTPQYPGGNGQGSLTGTGSTAVVPTMSKWATEYNKLYPGVKVNYQGTGSGNGRTQFLAKTVDFAGTDAFLSDKQFAQAGGPTAALHIPITMWGVTIPYNVPGVTARLKLDGPTLANIYLGHITNWNDPAIAALNSGVALPDLPIAVVHRSDGSGTTFNFTDYLNKVSPEWQSTVGSNTVVNWPLGIGGQGSDGVTQLVKQTEGAIGYVEVSYATQNNIPYALLKNQAGNFVDASSANVSAAAENLINTSIPADLRYSVTNAPGANSYPIAATTWLLVYADQTQDPNKGELLAYFLWWASHEGQAFSDALGYAPLPPSIVQRVEQQIHLMNCGATKCFPQ